jgi:hypothetical protein
MLPNPKKNQHQILSFKYYCCCYYYSGYQTIWQAFPREKEKHSLRRRAQLRFSSQPTKQKFEEHSSILKEGWSYEFHIRLLYLIKLFDGFQRLYKPCTLLQDVRFHSLWSSRHILRSRWSGYSTWMLVTACHLLLQIPSTHTHTHKFWLQSFKLVELESCRAWVLGYT